MKFLMLRLTPAGIRRRWLESPQLRLIAENFGWLVGDRVLRMGFGMLIGVWMARYLGPEQFGMFTYVQAVIALFLGFSTLGLDTIVVQQLVREVGSKARILGTTLALRLVGALAALVASLLVIAWSRPGDHLIQLLAAILGSATVFQAFDTVDLWFQSQVQSKYTVIVKNTAFAVMAVVKVYLILSQAPVLAFAWATLAEAGLGGLFLLLAYRYQKEDPATWQVDWARAKSLMQAAWPMILSSLAVMIYMRIDQIMLGQISGNQAVGVFSAASRISEVWYFIPMAIASSVTPNLVAAKELGEAIYQRRFEQFFRLMVALALLIVVPVAIFAKPLVVLLYGYAYASAGPILAIQIWTAVFVFLGVAQGPWFVIENLTKLALQRTMGGAVVNVGLNILLIPRYGGLGAAVASLVAQIISNVVMNALDRRTLHLFWMVLKSFNLLSKSANRSGPGKGADA